MLSLVRFDGVHRGSISGSAVNMWFPYLGRRLVMEGKLRAVDLAGLSF